MTQPQLVIQDMGGIHNKDGELTAARLMRGASWKRQRIVVILPCASMISARVALSHWNLAFPPNNGVMRILAVGQEVGEAYSNAISAVLADPNLREWEFVLTIESDNAPPPDGVLRLVEHMEAHPEFACIGGLYFTKGPGGVAQIWGDPKDPIPNFRPQLPDMNGGLVETCGTGMGFNLFRMAIFKDDRLRKPWFKTQKENGVATQDLYAWMDWRKHGYRAAIACDVRVGHWDEEGAAGGGKEIMW